jgi:hypothetical protein
VSDPNPKRSERLLGYPNSPKSVRVFWHTVGVLLNLGMVGASIWIGFAVLVGAVEGLRNAWHESHYATIGSFAVFFLYVKLHDRLPWTYR